MKEYRITFTDSLEKRLREFISRDHIVCIMVTLRNEAICQLMIIKNNCTSFVIDQAYNLFDIFIIQLPQKRKLISQ